MEIDGGDGSAMDGDLREATLNTISKSLANTRCIDCKSCMFKNYSSILTDSLKETLQTAVKLFNENYKNKLHERNIVSQINGFLNNLFSTSWSSCVAHVSIVNKEIVQKLVTSLIQQECSKLNREQQLKEQRSANAAKISELSGKGKWYV